MSARSFKLLHASSLGDWVRRERVIIPSLDQAVSRVSRKSVIQKRRGETRKSDKAETYYNRQIQHNVQKEHS